MQIEKIYNIDKYSCPLKGTCYQTTNEPKSALVVYHGMAEYTKRYEDFAEYLSNNNIQVYCIDLIGHGYSKLDDQTVGAFDMADPCQYLIECMNEIYKKVREELPNVRIDAIGHSMGSMLLQRYIELYPDDFDNVILSGTDIGGVKYTFLKLLTACKIKKHGYLYYDSLIQSLTLDGFNKKFKNEGELSWLSINKTNVEKYKADPLCGEKYPINYYHSLAITMNDAIKKENLKLVKTKKIFMITGKDDPVSGFTKSSLSLYKKYQKLNLNVQHVIIDNARHETLNESFEIRNNVYNLIYTFLK